MYKKTRWYVGEVEGGGSRLRNSHGSTYWFTPQGIWLTGHRKQRVTSHAVVARLERAMATAERSRSQK